MTGTRMAILADARMKTRTLDSVPDPHGRARAIYADLVRLEG